MRRFPAALRKLVGLFIDDGRFAVIILLWIAAMAMLPPSLPVPPIWKGPLLFAGLALALAWSCRRRVPRRGT